MRSRHDHTPALILGNGLTVLGTTRCLASVGVESYCLSEGLGFESASRWCRRTSDRVSATDGASALARVLEGLPLERGVLFSCSDYWTIELEALPEGLTSRFPSSVPEAGMLAQFIDKGAFGRLLTAAGVPHPTTVSVDGEEELVELLGRLPAGVFLKPTDSQRFLREFRVKAFKVDAVDVARRRYREAAGAGLNVLLQEYVPGPPDRHYFIDGFVDRTHTITAAFARRRLRMYPPDFGNSSHLISEPLDVVSDALSSLRRLFLRARYRGIFSAEFKSDERDGVFKLIEVNCRPWWYVEFAAHCGVNVVDFAYRDALGMPAPDSGEYRVGVGLVHSYYDFHACRRMRREGTLSLSSWVGSWLTSKKAVFRIDDPAPALSRLVSRARDRLSRARGA